MLLTLFSEGQERLVMVMTWFWTIAIGVVVALLAFFVIYGIAQISLLKFQLIMCTDDIFCSFFVLFIDDTDFEHSMYLTPFALLLLVNTVFALLTMTVILVFEVRDSRAHVKIDPTAACCCWIWRT